MTPWATFSGYENIIQQFDIPDAGKAVTDVVEVKYGDPSEIVQMLRMLLGESPDGGRGRRSFGGRVYNPSRSGGGNPGGPPQGPGGAKTVASSVTIPGSEIPIVLIPEPKRKWIIVSGSAEDVKKIREWVEKLDRQEPVQSEYETVAVAYADPQEVADRIERSLEELPGSALRPSVVVQALQQSRQIMIFGRADLRDMVKKLIVEVDIPAGTFVTEHFQLKHADPEQIKQNLDSLYGENVPRYEQYSYYRYGPGSRRTPADTVKVIAFPAMQQLTVIASAENMEKIRKQIAEWDVPLNVEAVKPRIIELRNSDPIQMAELLSKLFSEETDTSRSFMRMIFFGDMGDQRQKIVGPLYGQLTFEAVQGTKKIIVISKVPQAYDVIEQLVLDLDRQEMAESPARRPDQVRGYGGPRRAAERDVQRAGNECPHSPHVAGHGRVLHGIERKATRARAARGLPATTRTRAMAASTRRGGLPAHGGPRMKSRSATSSATCDSFPIRGASPSSCWPRGSSRRALPTRSRSWTFPASR